MSRAGASVVPPISNRHTDSTPGDGPVWLLAVRSGCEPIRNDPKPRDSADVGRVCGHRPRERLQTIVRHMIKEERCAPWDPAPWRAS